jgi:hypothetical protein
VVMDSCEEEVLEYIRVNVKWLSPTLERGHKCEWLI